MDDDTVKHLVKKAQNGDRDAFEDLLNHIYYEIFKMAFHYCNNQTDAEDITQNACIKLARNIDKFNFRSKFSSWLYRLVINCGHDHVNSTAKHKAGQIHENTASASHRLDQETYHKQVLDHVNDLPHNEKTALLLVFAKGLNHAQAAEIMECKESTVSWYIHEARKKLDAFKNRGIAS